MKPTRSAARETLFRMHCAALVDGKRCGRMVCVGLGAEGFCAEHLEAALVELEQETQRRERAR